MPRDGSGVYTTIPGTHGVSNTTITSVAYNANVDDVATDLNAARPIVAGGTGATNAVDAMTALGGEMSKQAVTNYDANPIQSGSFFSAAGATSAPTANGFIGIAYASDANNMFLQARDTTTLKVYVRQKSAGVWATWLDTTPPANAAAVINTPAGNIASTDVQSALNELDTEKVAKAGDTMTGPLVLSRASGADELVFQNASDGTRKTYRMAAGGVLEYVNNAYTAVIESHDDGGNVRLSGGLSAARATLAGAVPAWPLAAKTGSNQNIGFYDGGGGNAGIGSINDAQTAWQPILTTSNWTFQNSVSVGGNLTVTGQSSVSGNLTVTGQAFFNSGGITVAGWGGSANVGVIFMNSAQNQYIYNANGNLSWGSGIVTASNGRLWGSGDFASIPAAPNLGGYVSDGRLALAGDTLAQAIASSIGEPYAGAVITGWQSNQGFPYAEIEYFRSRYMQLLTANRGWYTVGYVG